MTQMGALQRFLDRAHLRHSRNSRLCPQISRVGLKCATLYRMMPGGHLATAIALGGVAYAATGSREAAVGCFAGGFLFDFDPYLGYPFFEKKWRRPRPRRFLTY